MISLIDDAKKIQEKINEEKTLSNLPITREDAIKLINSFPQENYDKIHYLMSEAVTKNVGKRLGEDENYCAMLGLLHDIDWAITKDNPETHLTKAPEILKKVGFNEEFIEIVLSHGYGFNCAGLIDKKRTKKIEFILAASETVTGLIYAYALMRNNNVSNMEVKGLMKKYKDKAFAAKVDRDIIQEIENTNITLDEFFDIAIKGIIEIKDIIRLE